MINHFGPNHVISDQLVHAVSIDVYHSVAECEKVVYKIKSKKNDSLVFLSPVSRPPSNQMHVLTFTVYQLLSAISPTLKSGDLDPCMSMLIGVRASHLQIPHRNSSVFFFLFFFSRLNGRFRPLPVRFSTTSSSAPSPKRRKSRASFPR